MSKDPHDATSVPLQDALPRHRPHPPDLLGHRGGEAVLRRSHQLSGE